MYLRAIGNIKETLPAFDKTPQPLEGGGTTVAYHPGKNSSLQGNRRLSKSTACCACYPHRFAVPGAQLPLGFLQILGHRPVDGQPLE